jgi:hypothetical protein
MASVNITPNLVPPAALVTFVQKGLQYMEAEANLDPVSNDTHSPALPVALFLKMSACLPYQCLGPAGRV